MHACIGRQLLHVSCCKLLLNKQLFFYIGAYMVTRGGGTIPFVNILYRHCAPKEALVKMHPKHPSICKEDQIGLSRRPN